MEMTEEEFWQKMCIAAAGAPAGVTEKPTRFNPVRRPVVHPTVVATEALQAYREKFRGRSADGAPEDFQLIRSNCSRCKALNEEDVDLTVLPEGTSTRKDCDNCDFTYTYEVRIDNS